MSWAADDRQFLSLCDGFGWGQTETFHNSRMLTISGDPEAANFQDLPGYPECVHDRAVPATWYRYYGLGTLAIDNHVYQFLSTPNRPIDSPKSRFVGAKLIYSSDNGCTWHNQDGSSPVFWQDWGEKSADNMFFFEEPGESFSLISVLQMGRNYEANRDGYVYLYSPNGNIEGTMNQLALCRVPKANLLERSAYQFFAGRSGDGAPEWSSEISEREPIHNFPDGWVSDGFPYSWQPSVAYNKGLDAYMMATWGWLYGEEPALAQKPSYLGIWISASPWGPWDQIYEEPAWTPGHDQNARAYQPQIAPKWIAKDGRSFWLVWSDFQEDPNAPKENPEAWRSARAGESVLPARELEVFPELRPRYCFNAQRVELDV